MGSAAGRTQQGDQFRKLSVARRRSRDEEFDAGAETEGLVFARRVQSFEELADDVKVGIVDHRLLKSRYTLPESFDCRLAFCALGFEFWR